MALLLGLVAALAPAPADRPSPVNPLAAIPLNSVASVVVETISVPMVPGYGPAAARSNAQIAVTRCSLNRADAAAFAAAVARARPLARQDATVDAGFSAAVVLDEGQAIGVVGGWRAITGNAHRATFLINGWDYVLERTTWRKIGPVLKRCKLSD